MHLVSIESGGEDATIGSQPWNDDSLKLRVFPGSSGLSVAILADKVLSVPFVAITSSSRDKLAVFGHVLCYFQVSNRGEDVILSLIAPRRPHSR